MTRLLGCLYAGLAAFFLARGAGLPTWVDWPTDWTLRDATDVAVIAFLAAWLLTTKERKD